MLIHDFYLLPESDDGALDSLNYDVLPVGVKLHDDVVLYLIDTLMWIPSVNPSNPNAWCGYGLNYYGPTVINKAGAGKAERIFRLWAALFQEGPAVLELHGGFEWIEGEPATEGNYKKVTVSRDQLVETLEEIADYAQKVTTGKYLLLHRGI